MTLGIMLTTLAIAAFPLLGVALLLLCVSLFFASERATQKRQIRTAFKSLEIYSASGILEFAGNTAQVLAFQFDGIGQDPEGLDSGLRYRCLCTMPHGGKFQVTVEVSRDKKGASSSVSQLTDAAFSNLSRRYPYAHNRWPAA